MAGGTTERRIQVKVEADTADFQRNMREAAAALKATQANMQKLSATGSKSGTSGLGVVAADAKKATAATKGVVAQTAAASAAMRLLGRDAAVAGGQYDGLVSKARVAAKEISAISKAYSPGKITYNAEQIERQRSLSTFGISDRQIAAARSAYAPVNLSASASVAAASAKSYAAALNDMRASSQALSNELSRLNVNPFKNLQSVDLTGVKTRLTGLTSAVQEHRVAWGDVGFVAAGAAAALGVATFGASRAAANFDQTMSSVKVNTGATGAALEMLRAKAMEMGATTVFSSTEAADGMDQLAKAGVSTADIYGGALKGALDLAAAGEMAVGEAAETAATAMTQFGLKGSDIPHIADLLASGAASAQGEVKDLAFAMKQGGLVAGQMGMSVDETVSTLTAFAASGMIGSDAGTSLRTMMVHLMAPTKRSADLMKDLGISVYDSSGEFVGMAGLADQLQKNLGDLSAEQRNAALATIFGMDALRGANILYKEGAAGMEEWEKKVNNSGFAAKAAAEKLNNLNGDLRLFKSAWQNAQIGAGQGMNELFRPMVQGATNAVRAFGELSPGMQKAAGIAGLVGTGIAAAGTAFVLAVPKIASFKTAMLDLGMASQGTLSKVGAVAKGVGKFAGIAGTVATLWTVGDSMLDGKRLSSTAADAEIGNIANGINTAQIKKSIGIQDGTKRFALRTVTDLLNGQLVDWDKKEGQNLNYIVRQLNKSTRTMHGFGLHQAWNKANAGLGGLFGLDLRNNFARTEDYLKSISPKLTALAQSDLPLAQKAFKQLGQSMTDGSQKSLEALMGSMGDFNSAISMQLQQMNMEDNAANRVALATGKISATSKLATKDITGMGNSMETASQQMSALISNTLNAADAWSNVQLGKMNYEETVSGAYDALKQYKMGNGTPNDMKRQLLGIAAMGREQIAAMVKESEAAFGYVSNDAITEMNGVWEQTRKDAEAFYDALAGMGIPLPWTREEFIRQTGLDKPFPVDLKANAEAFLDEVNGIRIEGTANPAKIKIDGETQDAEMSIAKIFDLTADKKGLVTIGANTYDAEMSFYDLIGAVETTPGVFKFKADDGSEVIAKAHQISTEINKETGEYRLTIKDDATGQYKFITGNIKEMSQEAIEQLVTADTDEARAALEMFRKDENGKWVYVGVEPETEPAANKVYEWREDEKGNPVRVRIDSDPASAKGKVYEWRMNEQGLPTLVPVDANTAPANGQVNGFRNAITGNPANLPVNAKDNFTGPANAFINSVPSSKTVSLQVNAAIRTVLTSVGGGAATQRATMGATGGAVGDLQFATGRKALRYAGGGAVRGPGSATSDDVLAWLGNGEHVLTGDEVRKVGGQDAVYRMRAAIRAGMLRFADGGSVGKSYGVSNVKVNAAAPVANVTVIVDNPLTGEQIRSVARSEADGRIVYAARLNR